MPQESITSREKVKRLFDLKGQPHCAFWTGQPHKDAAEIYLKKLGYTDLEQLFQYLQDDCRFIWADQPCAYFHPQGKPMFDAFNGKPRTSLSQPGCLAEAETVAEVEAIDWPKVEYLDFTEIYKKIRSHPGKSVLTGMWSPFFHLVADYFGMEEYFIKMYTSPAVVEAATEKIIDFYIQGNIKFYEGLKGEADVFFFGNDFGSQLDLLVSPENFDRFVLPGFKRLIDMAHGFGQKVMLHSCGSIIKVLPRLIDAGIDGLHPLQAKAAGMEAKNLAQFKGKIVFCGGVDTQDLLVHAKPQEIRDEVRRLRDLLGPYIIISPSHEALLSNVPLDNVIAMAEAARE